jgi:hypothetical protein
VKIKIGEKKTKNYSLFEETGAEHQMCLNKQTKTKKYL